MDEYREDAYDNYRAEKPMFAARPIAKDSVGESILDECYPPILIAIWLSMMKIFAD